MIAQKQWHMIFNPGLHPWIGLNDVLIEGNIAQYKLLKNYFRSINKQIVFLNEVDGDDKKLFWHLCYLSINLKSKCQKPAVKNQILKIDSKNFHLVSINLYKIQ